MHIVRLCAVWSLLLLSPAAPAAAPDPSLRSSEQLDPRRLGKVSEDERSVLRIEWRAAVMGAEESLNMQAMLDSIRRMEGTLGEIRRLMQNIPVQKPVLAAADETPPESDDHDRRLLVANIAAACLVALWWYRRRNFAKLAEQTAAVTTAPAQPPLEAAPSPAPAARVAVAEDSQHIALASEVAARPVKAEAPPVQAVEPRAPAVAPQRATHPLPTRAPAPAPPPAPQPVPHQPVIDFMLEDAEPEDVARENKRLQQLEAMDRRKDPERKQTAHVDPTLELADIMLSLGLEQGAAQALVEYTEAHPRQALHHWLKLLDIYRKSGNREEFKEATEKLRRNFNIQADDWAKEGVAEAQTLENFPRLAEQVQQTWSRPEECLACLQNLLEDNREGARAGFPRPVAEEILLLIDVLKDQSDAGQAAAT